MDDVILDWLVESDAAIRWQVERDRLHKPPEVWEATRAGLHLYNTSEDVSRLFAATRAQGDQRKVTSVHGSCWKAPSVPYLDISPTA
jgi:hypothetical protein